MKCENCINHGICCRWEDKKKGGCTKEPCEDAISRQAAIDAFDLSEKTRKYGGDHSGYDTLMKYEIQNVLENLPPVIPQQARWISVSERLPEKGEEVVIVARYQGEQYGFTCGLVSAWMPLPKPYESQESEDKE